ncbi:hypothetical protein [Nevskia soli]|uniref:hypothetical protein n=1 Tax=Nevskia soli TaxID=418856 RepID=UPI0004A768C9|nr:hypothetical protein [Nevskia soli]
MSTKFDRVIRDRKALMERSMAHLDRPWVSYAEHIKASRFKRAQSVADRTIIYLDTNAWLTIANVRINKQRVTAEMRDFERQIARAVASSRFLFPIGLSTFFELDAIADNATRASLIGFVDEMCQGFCVETDHTLFDVELRRIEAGDSEEYRHPAEFLRRPMELVDPINMSRPDEIPPDFVAHIYYKTRYDIITECSFSDQLEFTRAHRKKIWDNKALTDQLNETKLATPIKAPELFRAMVGVFKSLIELHCQRFKREMEDELRQLLVLRCLYLWDQNPGSAAFPTIRINVTLWGLMQADPTRRFHHGDVADFEAAASALPLAAAFYTDRKLANFLNDPQLAPLRSAFPCEVVSGFSEMAQHLAALIEARRRYAGCETPSGC